MDYEPELCDLVRAIDLTLIALVEPETDARIVQVALENAQRMATDFNKKWYADCKRLTGLGNRLSLGASIRNRACTPRGMFSLIRGVRPILRGVVSPAPEQSKKFSESSHSRSHGSQM